jgi:hypothetical protein
MAQDILIKGEAVPESIVAKMIDEKMNSLEVAHHGKFKFLKNCSLNKN